MTEAQGPVCIPNITARGRRRRLASGIAWLFVALAGTVALVLRPEQPWACTLPFLPFTMAGIGFFQAREKT